jgi:hypothetical protein
LPDRVRTIATFTIAAVLAWTLLGVGPVAAADPLKVVIIVGPTG